MPGLPAYIWTLAIVAGISVANLYYNLAAAERYAGDDLGVSDFQANPVAMITQIGYALGLLFIRTARRSVRREKRLYWSICFLLCLFCPC